MNNFKLEEKWLLQDVTVKNATTCKIYNQQTSKSNNGVNEKLQTTETQITKSNFFKFIKKSAKLFLNLQTMWNKY